MAEPAGATTAGLQPSPGSQRVSQTGRGRREGSVPVGPRRCSTGLRRPPRQRTALPPSTRRRRWPWAGWTGRIQKVQSCRRSSGDPTMRDVRRLWLNTMGPAIPPGRLLGVAIRAVRPRLSARRYMSPAAVSIPFLFSSCVWKSGIGRVCSRVKQGEAG